MRLSRLDVKEGPFMIKEGKFTLLEKRAAVAKVTARKASPVAPQHGAEVYR